MLDDVLCETSGGWFLEGGDGEEVSFDVCCDLFGYHGHGCGAAADIPVFEAFDKDSEIDVTPLVGLAFDVRAEEVGCVDGAKAREDFDGGGCQAPCLSVKCGLL